MDHSAQGSRQQGILRCKYILLLSSFSLPSLVPFFFYSRIALATVDTNMCSFLCYSITCDRSRWKMGCRLGIHERAAIPTRKKKTNGRDNMDTFNAGRAKPLFERCVTIYVCVCVCVVWPMMSVDFPFFLLKLALSSRLFIYALRSTYIQSADHHDFLSGRHNWYATSHARPTYCNVCREALSGEIII